MKKENKEICECGHSRKEHYIRYKKGKLPKVTGCLKIIKKTDTYKITCPCRKFKLKK